MKWSWKIGQLAGIDLRLHATFLLLLGWVGMSYRTTGNGMETMLAAAGFIASLFACVVCHEMGHALTARRFGIQTRDITLLPVGGVARLERMPEDPRQELWVALAGPAVNAAIAAILFGWLALNHQWETFGRLGVVTGPFVERLMMANIALALFNLIPAFPVDGGRVLRALLASRMSYRKATQLAASCGQTMALLLGFAGLFVNPMLLFIGLSVWIGAGQEACASQIRSALSGTPARVAMLTEFEKLHSGDTLAVAVRLTLRGSPHDFPVLDGGHVIGILRRTDLWVALAGFGQDHPVEQVMRREFLTGEPNEMLELTFRRLKEGDCHTMPIVQGGLLVGLVTMESLGEYLVNEAALQESNNCSGLARRILRGKAQTARQTFFSANIERKFSRSN
jgi:Zn-dependent protease